MDTSSDVSPAGDLSCNNDVTSDTALPFKPIGYLQSPFAFKNGTPRQAMVCSEARGIIRVEKTVFNNPEHSLLGLENFSLVWIIFVFHKNDGSYTKAKVRPPRLNGGKVGLFSTRSPYRPNNIGLSLAKIEKVEGAVVTVSGIDILDGTPVLDLKPYIEQYDNPGKFPTSLQGTTSLSETSTEQGTIPRTHSPILNSGVEPEIDSVNKARCTEIGSMKTVSDVPTVLDTTYQAAKLCTPQSGEVTSYKQDFPQDNCDHLCRTENHKVMKDTDVILDSCDISLGAKATVQKDADSQNGTESEKCDSCCHQNGRHIQQQSVNQINSQPISQNSRHIQQSSVADWINSPPVSTLHVRFTQRALDQLSKFSTTSEDVRYRLKFMKTVEEARQAMVNILHEDPRSVYRRTKCADSLYFFTVDVVHVTCWFDSDDDGAGSEGAVEVVRVKPACDVEQCKHKFSN